MKRDDLVRQLTAIRTSILGYLRMLVRDAHLAEDLLQETCVVVLRKIDTFEPSISFAAWVRAIALNLARNAVRKGKHVHLMPSPELLGALERTLAAEPAREIEEVSEQLETLADCMAELDPRHTDLLRQRYGSGLSLRDLAARMGRSAGAVQVALTRIRQALLRCLERQKSQVHHG